VGEVRWEVGYVDTPSYLDLEEDEQLISREELMEILRESAVAWAQEQGGELAQGPVWRVPATDLVHYSWPVIRPVIRHG
jgi:hypothetical protein